MWDLEENASAIASLGIASAGAAVRQIEQYLNSLAYDFMAFVAANIGHEPDPAGVVLLRRMVETLGRRKAIRFFCMRRHGHICSMGMVEANWAASRSVVLELGFRREGCGGAHTSAQEHFCKFLVTARRAGKYNSEFRCDECKFQNLAVPWRNQPNFPLDLRSPL